MLIFTRNVDEAFHIGDNAKVTVLGIKGNQVRIGVDAPKDTRVDRAEIRQRRLNEEAILRRVSVYQYAFDCTNGGSKLTEIAANCEEDALAYLHSQFRGIDPKSLMLDITWYPELLIKDDLGRLDPKQAATLTNLRDTLRHNATLPVTLIDSTLEITEEAA
ncbi:carbon storage regulator [Marinobacterium lutimaris]|uniref:Translational regulator CsrA n=1 Tax=Marinobacterium lutimaris TaxID=568106 RepID=A0A1H5XWT0_9GAMM|nr:carbon storage regulator, CsrA [Marinobacterium lutimaris]